VLRPSYGYTDDTPRDRAKVDELAREYHDTHDTEIPEEIYRLSRELEKVEKLEKQ
jgi:hypothetical protein